MSGRLAPIRGGPGAHPWFNLNGPRPSRVPAWWLLHETEYGPPKAELGTLMACGAPPERWAWVRITAQREHYGQGEHDALHAAADAIEEWLWCEDLYDLVVRLEDKAVEGVL